MCKTVFDEIMFNGLEIEVKHNRMTTVVVLHSVWKSLKKVSFFSILRAKLSLTTSLCPLMQAFTNGVFPHKSFALKSMFKWMRYFSWFSNTVQWARKEKANRHFKENASNPLEHAKTICTWSFFSTRVQAKQNAFLRYALLCANYYCVRSVKLLALL